MATKKPASKKSTSINVDFEGVESGGGGAVPEGNYLVEVDEVTKETSENSGADYLAFIFKVKDGGFKGKKLFHNCSLQPQALFNLRGVLEALGFEVPDGPMDLDITDLVGETCGVATIIEKYEGKDKARCVEFFTEEQFGQREEGGDETPAKVVKPATAGKAKPEPEPEPTKVVKKAAKKKAAAFEEGDEVTFEDDEGNEQTGTITGVDDDTYTVTVGKGKKATEWELEADDLTKVEE
jgi:transcription antitermination factor NusG